jgi:predicted lipoprotein with Yx(FWY)xxD motif
LTVTEGMEPTAAPGITGTLSYITRDDGALQVTYEDRPLYYFINDAAPGDLNGEGVNDVWYLVPVTITMTTP